MTETTGSDQATDQAQAQQAQPDNPNELAADHLGEKAGESTPDSETESVAAASAEPDPVDAPAEPEAGAVESGEAGEEAEPEPAPAPSTWDELDLPERLRVAVDRLGWTAPTKVQGRTFATMVAGSDVLVQSHTGSGKTGAFCLPWLANRFEFGPARETGVQLIVLLPTREIAKHG
ncbi:MAG: DEAD/DEAH box helicase [Myxococcales bacterium]|nr:DEAD/DEAH box helicase [Myxococcales bacterium]